MRPTLQQLKKIKKFRLCLLWFWTFTLYLHLSLRSLYWNPVYHHRLLKQALCDRTSTGGQGRATWTSGVFDALLHWHACFQTGEAWIGWMDHTADKELAVWPQAKSCGQRLIVHTETSGAPQGSVLGLIQHLCWWQGEWDQALTQHICWSHQAVW